MDVKRLTLTFLLFLFVVGNILLLASPCVRSGYSVSPAKLFITIEDYPLKEIHYKFEVGNPYSYDVRASTRVVNPFRLDENYTRIPDLSWIKIIPETLDISRKSCKEFEVIIDIPEKEKTLHYNESWEAWVIVTPRPLSGEKSAGVLIQVQLAVKLFIHTPTGTMGTQAPLGLYLLIGIIGGFVILITFSSIIKKKRTENLDRAAIFYVKKKENDTHKKN